MKHDLDVWGSATFNSLMQAANGFDDKRLVGVYKRKVSESFSNGDTSKIFSLIKVKDLLSRGCCRAAENVLSQV